MKVENAVAPSRFVTYVRSCNSAQDRLIRPDMPTRECYACFVPVQSDEEDLFTFLTVFGVCWCGKQISDEALILNAQRSFLSRCQFVLAIRIFPTCLEWLASKRWQLFTSFSVPARQTVFNRKWRELLFFSSVNVPQPSAMALVRLALTAVAQAVIFLVFYVFFIPTLVLAHAWKLIVRLLVRLQHGGAVQIMGPCDAISAHKPSPSKEGLIHAVFHVRGPVSLKEVRRRVAENLVELKNADGDLK